MNLDEVSRFIQEHFTDGLVVVIGSGLSAAEGISGMGSLADHLQHKSTSLSGADAALWRDISTVIADNRGLEAALIEHPPSPSLEPWIISETIELLLPEEQRVVSDVVNSRSSLRLTALLQKIMIPDRGLPIITTNYDRLVELACEMAGLHVDTTTLGHFAAEFDDEKSCMSSCIGIKRSGKQALLNHRERAVVLKPHGSLDWFQVGNTARRCSMDVDAERLIITPVSNKYRAGYEFPFDRQRELANRFIDRCSKLLIVGYGFNDDHLQTHLHEKIREGIPTLIVTRSISRQISAVVNSGPNCICVSRDDSGSTVTTKDNECPIPIGIWDIGVLADECL